MKTIILIGNVPSSLINFRKELIISLVSKKYRVYCLASKYSDYEASTIRSWGAIPENHELNSKGLNPYKDFIAAIKLYKQIKQISPDIVFPFFVKPVIFGSFAAKLAKVPRVVGMIEGLGNAFTPTPDGQKEVLKIKLIRNIQVFLYKLSLPLLDHLIVLNPDDQIDLIQYHNIKVKQTTVLGGIGVDLSKFSFSPACPSKSISFIFIARLLKEKGIFEFLEAAKIVKNKYPNTVFKIIGGLDENNPFGLKKDTLLEYIHAGLIIYPGHVDNVPEWIRNSDIFVLPSFYREGVPRSTQEAMAIGRPIITTNMPGCKETVIPGKNGFLIPPWNSKILSEKMIFFIENPEYIQIMGNESRLIAEERFNIDKVNIKLINILNH